MKQILFALAAIAIVLVSCNKNNDPEDPGEETQDSTLTITMKVIGTPTATGAVIVYTPSDDSIYYAIFCIPTEDMSQETAQSLAGKAYAAIAEDGFERRAYQGVDQVDWTGELDPDTKYTPVAIQIDEEGTVYETLYEGPEFTTAKLPQSTMTVAFSYDGVTFTPSGSDDYVAFILDSTLFKTIEGAEEYGYCEIVATAVLEAFAGDAEYIFNGTQTLGIEDFAYGTVTNGDNVYAMATPVREGCINGPISAQVITVGSDMSGAPRRMPKIFRQEIKMMRK